MKVTYTFCLPDNSAELEIFSKAEDYASALNEIYQECRKVWKYEENPSRDKVEFAERIGQICIDQDIL